MSNKENITLNKVEGPMLRMEPMSMKKKKKGGGYNLRKSIAWNRAFFTEEGVLDPEELSLISGTQVGSSTEGISTLKEEAMDSIDEDFEFIDNSSNLQELEKHLFRGNPSTCSQENRETGFLPSKLTSPACSSKSSTSEVTPQAKRAGFISGASPSLLPSSSLKRPASVNACKPASEVSKIPKVPVSKSRNLSFLSSSKSSKSGTASSMKNQILRPVDYKQMILEPKSYKRSVNTPMNKAKEGSDILSVKSSALHVKRNKVNPPLNLPVSSTQLPHPQVNKVENSGPKVIHKDGLNIIREDLSEDQYVNAQTVDSIPSKNVITGRALQQSKVQSNKPSGLRKPSPSIGFFDQSKASSSNRFSRRDVGSLPQVKTLGDKRPPAKLPQVLNSNVPSANSLISSLRHDRSSQSNTSTRPSDEVAEAEKTGKEILDKREQYVPRSDEQVMHVAGSEEKIFHHARNEISTASEEDRGVVVNECKKLLATGPCKDLSKDAKASDCIVGDKTSGESIGEIDSQLLSRINFEQCDTDVVKTRTTDQRPCKEEKSSDSAATEHDIAVQFQNGAVNNSEVLSSALSSRTSLSCVSDVHQTPPCLGDDSQTSSGEKYAPDVYIPILKEAKFEKLIECPHISESGMIGDEKFNIEGPSKLELQDSSYSSELLCASQSEDSVIRGYVVDLLGQEAILQIPGLTLNGNIREKRLHQSSETEDLSNLSATQVELQAAFLKVEYDSNNVDGFPSADRVLIEKDARSEENQLYAIETSPPVLSDKRGKCKINDSDTLMSNVFYGVKEEEFYANKVSRLDLPKTGPGLAACRNVSSATSLDVLSCSSEVPIMEDNRTCDESKCAGQVEEIGQTSLILQSKICDEDQRCNLQSGVETDPTLHARSLIEWETHCRSPEVVDVMETRNIPIESGNGGYYSEAKNNLGFSALGFEPNLTISRTSVMCDQYVEDANHTVELYQPELQTSSILCTEVPDDKMKLLPGNCLDEEIAKTEKYDDIFASGCGAHNIPHKKESCGSELRSSNTISITTLKSCIEDLRSVCTEILPRLQSNELSSGSQLMHDAQLGGSPSQRDLTSPEGKYMSVGPMVSTSINETQPEVCENRDCLVQDTKCDYVTCQEKDEKDTAPNSEKSEETSNGRNLTIIPLKNAVPFSDEWLAAIEAAGEEILTMKSGAVQNSPTDKSLPEPSPWSPVKKKNNSIGPYDCTKKFINN